MIKALLLVTLLGQVGPGNRALKDQLNWQWWWNPAQDAPWVAKFGNPTCLPSGSVLSPGPTTLTVARADSQYVWNGALLVACPAATLAVGYVYVITSGSTWSFPLPAQIPVYCLAATANQVAGAATDVTEF